jgi:hypothetical protein
MRQAVEREQKGETAAPGQAPPPKPVVLSKLAAPPVKETGPGVKRRTGPSKFAVLQQKPSGATQGEPGDGDAAEEPTPLSPKQMSDLEKLHSLREIGVLTDAEFEVARKRLLSRRG